MAKPNIFTTVRMERGKAARRRGKAAQEYIKELAKPKPLIVRNRPEKSYKWWEDPDPEPVQPTPGVPHAVLTDQGIIIQDDAD